MAHQIAQPAPSPCPECGALRVPAEALNNIRLAKPGTKLPGITGGTTELWALVCPQCGHTSFYARDPQVLRE